MYWLSLAVYLLWRTNFIFIYASAYVTNLFSDMGWKMTAGAAHVLGPLAGATCLGSIWEKIKGGSVSGETLPDSPQGRENFPRWAASDLSFGGRQTPGCLGKNSQGIVLWEEHYNMKAVNPSPVWTITFINKQFSDTVCCFWALFSSKKCIKKNPPQLPLQQDGTHVPVKWNFPNHLHFLG